MMVTAIPNDTLCHCLLCTLHNAEEVCQRTHYGIISQVYFTKSETNTLSHNTSSSLKTSSDIIPCFLTPADHKHIVIDYNIHIMAD